MIKVDNAVIMAAGTSSRFAPLSFERPKALTEVKGDILIERQIRQLQNAGIKEICVVTGYKAEQLQYLKDKFNVILRHNSEYDTRNNNASIKLVEDLLKNTYICSADNYFEENPFASEVESAYYAAVYSEGETDEWCISTDNNDVINKVIVGGSGSWYMMGHTFWDEKFSTKYKEILDREYDFPETASKLWEDLYIEHLEELKMKIRRYPNNQIFEFDTLDELREFDHTYLNDTKSTLLKAIAKELAVGEGDIRMIQTIKGNSNSAIGFSFICNGTKYQYDYSTGLEAAF